MKRIKGLLLIFALIACSTNNMKGCNMNIDSLFYYHISIIDNYLKSVIDGYILPTGEPDRIILANITGNPIKTDYNDSSKFYIFGDNADFLTMYEFINDFEWERNESIPNIKISRKEIFAIKDWYNSNKDRLNCEKIEMVLYWIKNHYKTYTEKETSTEMFYELMNNDINCLKQMNTFIK